VSPDGKYLAWATPKDDRLHVRDPEGHEQIVARYHRRMRFSPDGTRLAAITDVGRGDWQKLVVLELATGQIQSLLTAPDLGQLEWARGGLVIARGRELVYVPLAGDHVVLYPATDKERLVRFTAAATSSRVILVVATHRAVKLRAVELDHPERARELGTVPASVETAEQSPDGARVVLATDDGLYVVDGDGAPRELSGRRDVHSLWFDPDGRVAYASPGIATVLDGKRARRLEPRAPINMMRFEKGSTRVLVASGRDARAWDPASGRQTVLASAPEGEQLLGADSYQGGVVLWTGQDHRAEPHWVARVLRATKDGTTSEVERIDMSYGDTMPFDRGFFMTSADGRSIAYRDLSSKKLRVTTADGKERAIDAGRAELSPDGRHVLVSRSPTPPHTALWSLIDTATGAERSLFAAQPVDASADVAFSGDGKWLAFGHTEEKHVALVMIEVATGKERTIPAGESISFAWTARGLLVWGPKNVSLVSASGELQPVLDEPVEAGLASVATSTGSARVLVCFRGGTDEQRAHPGLLWLDLDAPARPVELDVPICWNRPAWLSADGEQVVFSTLGSYAIATDDLRVLSVKGRAAQRGLGDAYNQVVFDGRGRFAFVSHRGVTVVDGTRDDLFETDGQVEALQFTSDSSLFFVIGREAIAWDLVHGTRTVLGRVPEGQRIVAAAPTSDGVMFATFE
jgi:hypothetical protein